MAKRNDPLTRIRSICLSLPDTHETPTWGSPHFRVGEKIFAGYGQEHGRASLSFKLESAHAAELVRGRRFRPAPYVGHKGWVSVDADAVTDRDAIAALILESYRLIAPRKSLAKLEASLTMDVMPTSARGVRSTLKSNAKSESNAKARSESKPKRKRKSKPTSTPRTNAGEQAGKMAADMPQRRASKTR
jgi:predicted DNA-binding protein (MmcQ/YjbR family)